jgi:hypothetical protein
MHCTARLLGCSPGPENETVVLAHIRFPGLGANIKLDSMALYACHHCHDIIDKRNNESRIMEKEILQRILYGMAETHAILIEKGHMVLR